MKWNELHCTLQNRNKEKKQQKSHYMQTKCKFSDTLDPLFIASHCSAFLQIRKNTCQCIKGQPFPIKCRHSFLKYIVSGCLFILFHAGNMLLSLSSISFFSCLGEKWEWHLHCCRDMKVNKTWYKMVTVMKKQVTFQSNILVTFTSISA